MKEGPTIFEKKDFVLIEPTNPAHGVSKLFEYVNPLGRGLPMIPISVLRRDERGVPLRENTETREYIIERPLSVQIRRGQTLQLHRERDKELIAAIMNCPHREGITEWKCPDTGRVYDIQELERDLGYTYPKRFRVSDPLEKQLAEEHRIEMETKAWKTASDVRPYELAYFHGLVLDIQVPQIATLDTWMRKVIDFAQNNPKIYFDRIVENDKLDIDVAMKLSARNGALVYSDANGFMLRLPGRNALELGYSKEQVYAKLIRMDDIFQELIRSAGREYQEYQLFKEQYEESKKPKQEKAPKLAEAIAKREEAVNFAEPKAAPKKRGPKPKAKDTTVTGVATVTAKGVAMAATTEGGE
jgi:hypothetical protein